MTEGNRRLLMRLDEVCRQLGFGPVTADDPRATGGAGLKGSADHTVNETADLTLLPIQMKRAAVLLCRLTR